MARLAACGLASAGAADGMWLVRLDALGGVARRMMGLGRRIVQIGCMVLLGLSVGLWHVQPAADPCAALGLVQDFYGDWSAVSIDGHALWPIQPDGGALLGAFPDWLILSGQGTPLRVRPDGSTARPLFAPPSAYPDFAVLAWSDDGQRLWFGVVQGGLSIYALDVSTGRIQPLQRLATTVNAVHQASAGYLLIFSTEQPKGDWYRFETSTQRLQQLTFTPTRFEDHLHVAPDGQWLLYDALDGNRVALYRQPREGGDEEALLTGPDGFIVLGWSPDGKRLAVWSAGRAVTLHVMDWPSGAWRTFDAPGHSRDILGWADNQRVLLSRYGASDAAGRLDLLNTDDGSISPLVERYHTLEVLPTTPPRIAYSVAEDGRYHLYTRTLPDGPPVYHATFTDQIVSMQPSPCADAALVETYAGLYLLRADGVAQRLRFMVVANGWVAAMPPHDWHPLAFILGGTALGVVSVQLRRR